MSDLNNENKDVVDDSPKTEEVAVESTPAPTPTPEPTPEVVETPKAAENVITATVTGGENKVQGLANVNGSIGSTAMVIEPKKPVIKKEKKDKAKTVAVHSTKNVTWPGVGKVYIGYNIVTEAESEQWLTRSHIRLATPEEVAKEFGTL